MPTKGKYNEKDVSKFEEAVINFLIKLRNYNARV